MGLFPPRAKLEDERQSHSLPYCNKASCIITLGPGVWDGWNRAQITALEEEDGGCDFVKDPQMAVTGHGGG